MPLVHVYSCISYVVSKGFQLIKTTSVYYQYMHTSIMLHICVSLLHYSDKILTYAYFKS